MISGCFQICFQTEVDVGNIQSMAGVEGGQAEQGVVGHHLPPIAAGLAAALVVVAFASLSFPFGVTASRRSGCASHVPEDTLTC